MNKYVMMCIVCKIEAILVHCFVHNPMRARISLKQKVKSDQGII